MKNKPSNKSNRRTSDDQPGQTPVRFVEPPTSAAIVITATLTDEAAKLFCPRVEQNAPEWAFRAAEMVLFSLMPIRLREEGDEMPPSLQSQLHDLAARLFVKHGGKPLPSEDPSCMKRGNKACNSHVPNWKRFQLFPPLWAIRFKRKMSNEYRAGFGCGLLSGACGLLPPKWSGASDIVGFRRQEAAQLPAAQALDFFTGQRDGEKHMQKMPERAKQMTQRAKIFQAIATQWGEITPGKLNTTRELYEWLCRQNVIQPVGQRTGKGGTDSREIRKVCKIIGLRYSDQQGRPQKLRPS